MFKIKTKDGELEASLEKVFETILHKSFVDIDKNENIKHLDDFVKFINRKVQLDHLDITHSQIYSIYFLAGYYYKLFLEKNDVKIIDKKKDK